MGNRWDLWMMWKLRQRQAGKQDRRDVSHSRRFFRQQVFLRVVNCHMATGRPKAGNSRANHDQGQDSCVLPRQRRGVMVRGKLHSQSGVDLEAPCSLSTGWLMSRDELYLEIRAVLMRRCCSEKLEPIGQNAMV